MMQENKDKKINTDSRHKAVCKLLQILHALLRGFYLYICSLYICSWCVVYIWIHTCIYVNTHIKFTELTQVRNPAFNHITYKHTSLCHSLHLTLKEVHDQLILRDQIKARKFPNTSFQKHFSSIILTNASKPSRNNSN